MVVKTLYPKKWQEAWNIAVSRVSVEVVQWKRWRKEMTYLD